LEDFHFSLTDFSHQKCKKWPAKIPIYIFEIKRGKKVKVSRYKTVPVWVLALFECWLLLLDGAVARVNV